MRRDISVHDKDAKDWEIFDKDGKQISMVQVANLMESVLEIVACNHKGEPMWDCDGKYTTCKLKIQFWIRNRETEEIAMSSLLLKENPNGKFETKKTV